MEISNISNGHLTHPVVDARNSAEKRDAFLHRNWGTATVMPASDHPGSKAYPGSSINTHRLSISVGSPENTGTGNGISKPRTTSDDIGLRPQSVTHELKPTTVNGHTEINPQYSEDSIRPETSITANSPDSYNLHAVSIGSKILPGEVIATHEVSLTPEQGTERVQSHHRVHAINNFQFNRPRIHWNRLRARVVTASSEIQQPLHLDAELLPNHANSKNRTPYHTNFGFQGTLDDEVNVVNGITRTGGHQKDVKTRHVVVLPDVLPQSAKESSRSNDSSHDSELRLQISIDDSNEDKFSTSSHKRRIRAQAAAKIMEKSSSLTSLLQRQAVAELILVLVLVVFSLIFAAVFWGLNCLCIVSYLHPEQCQTNQTVTYMAAVHYVNNLHSSIGFGNVVPKTYMCKIITCVYTVIGIPMCLFILNQLGELMMFFANAAWFHGHLHGRSLMRWLRHKKTDFLKSRVRTHRVGMATNNSATVNGFSVSSTLNNPRSSEDTNHGATPVKKVLHAAFSTDTVTTITTDGSNTNSADSTANVSNAGNNNGDSKEIHKETHTKNKHYSNKNVENDKYSNESNNDPDSVAIQHTDQLSHNSSSEFSSHAEIGDEDVQVPLYVPLLMTLVWVAISAKYFSSIDLDTIDEANKLNQQDNNAMLKPTIAQPKANKDINYNYADALYFTVMSVTTVGLGDLAPADFPKTFISWAFIFIGLATVSMCWTMVQRKVETRFREMMQDINRQIVRSTLASHRRHQDGLGASRAGAARWREIAAQEGVQGTASKLSEDIEIKAAGLVAPPLLRSSHKPSLMDLVTHMGRVDWVAPMVAAKRVAPKEPEAYKTDQASTSAKLRRVSTRPHVTTITHRSARKTKKSIECQTDGYVEDA